MPDMPTGLFPNYADVFLLRESRAENRKRNGVTATKKPGYFLQMTPNLKWSLIFGAIALLWIAANNI